MAQTLSTNPCGRRSRLAYAYAVSASIPTRKGLESEPAPVAGRDSCSSGAPVSESPHPAVSKTAEIAAMHKRFIGFLPEMLRYLVLYNSNTPSLPDAIKIS